MSAENNNEVVLGSRDEDSWKETLYLLSNPANAEHLRQSIAEANAGKFDEKPLLDDD